VTGSRGDVATSPRHAPRRLILGTCLLFAHRTVFLSEHGVVIISHRNERPERLLLGCTFQKAASKRRWAGRGADRLMRAGGHMY
jgi:hypothetical protein